MRISIQLVQDLDTRTWKITSKSNKIFNFGKRKQHRSRYSLDIYIYNLDDYVRL